MLRRLLPRVGQGPFALLILLLFSSASLAAEPYPQQGLESQGLKLWLDKSTSGGGLSGRALTSEKAEVLGPPDPEALPDGWVAQGEGAVRLAYLIFPTDRYGHAVLGDGLEAAGLRVVTSQGQKLDYQLPDQSVFEDLRPRLADLDGDGQDEIILVRSYQDRGAALVVLGLVGNEIRILAETPAIGLSYRWLNPAGVGDFSGDGQQEVAYVETPHIGGTLRFWRFERTSESQGRLRQIGSLTGFSNHAIGSRALGLSFVLSGKAGEADRLILPSADRQRLQVVGWEDGKPQVLATQTLESRVVSDFTAPAASAETGELFYLRLADGQMIRVTGKPGS
ncbi:FG-GAP repeat domain-containing protein [Rhodovibrionaceae bacterium A322]